MKRTALALTLILALLISIVLSGFVFVAKINVVKADSNSPITFSSGLTLYSPVNTTYSSNVVECNGTFNCPKGVQCSLNFSIDGQDQGGLPWSLNPNSIAIPEYYTVNGSFQLPQLPNGSHQLSIGIDEEVSNSSGILINRTTWVNTVYFTIDSSQPTPTLTPTPTPTITPTASPAVPEFPTLIILPLFTSAILLSLVFARKRNSLRNVSD
jgi:hypothetical protein